MRIPFPFEPRRLVDRLRLVFAVLLVLILGFSAQCIQQLRNVEQRKTEVLERSVPLFIQTRSIVDGLIHETERAERLSGRVPEDALAALRADFESAAPDLETMLGRLSDLSESGAASLRASMRTLARSTEDLFEIQAEQNGIEHRWHDHFSRLSRMSAELSTEVQRLRLDAFERLQHDLELATGEALDTGTVRDDAFRLNRLVSLELRVEALVDKVETRSTPTSDLSFDLRGIVQLVSRVREPAAQSLLSDLVTQIREEIAAIAGIERQRAALVARLDLSLADHADAIAGLRAEIGRSVGKANEAIDTAGAALDRTIDRALTSVLLLGALLTIFTSIVLVAVVERQLNIRMRALSHAAKRIAAGDYDVELGVGGSDELSEIAATLGEFKRTAKELTRSNSDLQSFAYAASHDLRSPMKAISDLAEWTLEDAQDELSADNVEKLELLCSRSRRLSALLDDLLDYARADGADASQGTLDLRAELDALSELHDPEGRYPIEVIDETGPVGCHVTPVRQILRNLVSNAIKHHDRPGGRISATCRHAGDRIEIRLSDDGPGIPARYHARIFDLFQTLESRDVVEGSGIGLSLIRKLAQRHGGEVWVESDPDIRRGTTFVVQLSAFGTAKGLRAA